MRAMLCVYVLGSSLIPRHNPVPKPLTQNAPLYRAIQVLYPSGLKPKKQDHLTFSSKDFHLSTRPTTMAQ